MFVGAQGAVKRWSLSFAIFFMASAVHAQGATDDYTRLVGTNSYSDFRAAYNPDVMAGSGNVVTLRTRHSGLSAAKLKLFLPPGTISFRTSIITYRVNQPGRVAARLNTLPESSAAQVVPDPYGFDSRKTLEKLRAGQEVKVYAPEESGVLVLSDADSGNRTPASEGGYVYMNFFDIPGQSFLSFDTVVEVDRTCYQNWFSNAAWDAGGNPSSQATHACSGSSGGGDSSSPTTLAGITPSVTSWKPGQSNIINVVPSPANATLPACTSSKPDLLSPTQNSDGRTAQFTVQPGAITANTSVILQCGGKTATVRLEAPATSNLATISPADVKLSTDSNGNAILKVIIQHKTADVGLNKKVSYWVGALRPAHPFFGPEELFYLTPASEGFYQWAQLATPSPISVVFAKDRSLVQSSQELIVPLGFKKADFAGFGITIHFGYQQENKDFQVIQYYWDSTK